MVDPNIEIIIKENNCYYSCKIKEKKINKKDKAKKIKKKEKRKQKNKARSPSLA